MRLLIHVCLLLFAIGILSTCQDNLSSPLPPTITMEELAHSYVDNGTINLETGKIVSLNNLDGTKSRYYLAEGDITIPEREYLNLGSNNTKQHHTTNRVECDRTITLFGSTFQQNTNCLTVDDMNALAEAVNRFNIVFPEYNVSFNTNIQSSCFVFNPPGDIVVFIDPNLAFPSFASADFPDEYGDPGYSIRLHTAFSSADHELKIGILMHELGHTLGLRHTDYDNDGCGVCPSIGAEHIPGTPDQNDYYSIMSSDIYQKLANGILDATFSPFDEIAIEYLFPFNCGTHGDPPPPVVEPPNEGDTGIDRERDGCC